MATKKVLVNLDLLGNAIDNAAVDTSTVGGETLTDHLDPTPVAEEVARPRSTPVFAAGTISWEQLVLSGTKIGTITINGVAIDVYAPAGGGGSATFDELVHCNDGIFVDSSEVEESDSGVAILYDGNGVLYFAGPNDTVTLTNLSAPTSNSDAANKQYVDGKASAIEEKIPSQASSNNQLADKAFVNSSVQTATSNFRGNWSTFAAIPTNASSYPADYSGTKTPSTNDYLVVEADENHNGQTWRYKYSGTWATDGKNGWNAEYEVNRAPLTSAQLAALNSGVTSGVVSQVSANTTAIAGKQNTIDSTHKLSYSLLSGTPTIPTALSSLSDDSTHRVVTDTEKSTWDGKQSALTGASGHSSSAKQVLINDNGTLKWVAFTSILTGTGEPSSTQGSNGDIYLQTS